MQTLPWILATYIPVEALYVVAVWKVTGVISRSSLAENAWSHILANAAGAALTSGIAVLVGQIWAIAVEIVRVHDGHLGYRTQFIPYMQIQLRMFAFGVGLFIATVLIRRYFALHVQRSQSARP